MSEREAFVRACVARHEDIVAICDRFGISEKTGHKWLQRFKAFGEAGLRDRSHAPHTPAHRVEARVAAEIIALRRRHPLYGPQKLRDWLRQHDSATPWPAASTIGELLKRAGLVRPHRRRHPPRERAHLDGRTRATAPNVVWTADFKGEFRLRSGIYCYPLTILDLHSHYLLDCVALPTTAVGPTRGVFRRLFQRYGLPEVIRTDNGVPFAQPNAFGRLGQLAYWWARLGIRPEHITPASPAENGAHERFHKTLKAHATRPASATFDAQQRRFNRFRVEYNGERPHAALADHQPPATIYGPAPRPYPPRLPPLLYPGATAVRLVSGSGAIKWRDHGIFLSHNLAGQYVGITARDDDTITVAYASLVLGDVDPATHRFTPHVHWSG